MTTGRQSVEVSIARIQCRTGWHSLHVEFDRVFGFPSFYGHDMNAWIDCMSSLDDANDELTQIHVARGKVLTLELMDAAWLRTHHREQYDAVVECSAFVNWRRVEQGEPSLLALSFSE